MNGYPEKPGLSKLGSLMKESQHSRSPACPFYSETGRRGHYTQINNTQLSQEAGLASLSKQSASCKHLGRYLKKSKNLGTCGKSCGGHFLHTVRPEEGSALPLSHSHGAEILVLDTVAVPA